MSMETDSIKPQTMLQIARTGYKVWGHVFFFVDGKEGDNKNSQFIAQMAIEIYFN